MSSYSSPSGRPILPAVAPLHATNSWVIRRARELIGYDKYDTIAKWIDEVSDDEGEVFGTGQPPSSGIETGLSSGAVRVPTRHPAGELEDYDPDCRILSTQTIVEALEAVARRDNGDVANKTSFFTSPDHVDDSVSSGSSPSYFQSLVSGSLGREPLLGEYKHPNFEVDLDAETAADSVDVAEDLVLRRGSALPPALSAPPPSGARVTPGADTGADPSRTTNEVHSSVSPPPRTIRYSSVVEPGSKPSKLSKLSALFKAPQSPSLTVPQSAYNTAQERKGKSPRGVKQPNTDAYPFTYQYPSAYPEIERCGSPLPSMRPVAAHVRPETRPRSLLSRALSSRINADPPNQALRGHGSVSTSQAPPTPTQPLLQSSNSGGRKALDFPETEREILRPVPLPVRRLAVSRPSWGRFRLSSFGRSRTGIEVPRVKIEGGDDKGQRGKRTEVQ